MPIFRMYLMPRKTLHFITLILIPALFVVWLWFQDRKPHLGSELAGIFQQGATSGPEGERSPFEFREYRNARYRFSLLYPRDLAVKEIDEGGGATTVTFENPGLAKGFQIFIVPYEGTQITEEQFLKDVPSGVREDVFDFYLNGILASTFFSTNAILGETREVWFVHQGYLYEITTLRDLSNWLAPILETWRFI